MLASTSLRGVFKPATPPTNITRLTFKSQSATYLPNGIRISIYKNGGL
jgi:hypothetical protein